MFSKSCKYGIRAILFLSCHSNENNKYGVKVISERLNVPQHFLAKILQQLSRNGLVSSSKGPTGGFYMSKKNNNASLLDIIESIDGPESFKNCVLGFPKCNSDNPCVMHHNVLKYRKGLLNMLENEKIHETC